MGWYLEALKKYAVFSGRARRMEFWYFVLFNLIVGIPLYEAAAKVTIADDEVRIASAQSTSNLLEEP